MEILLTCEYKLQGHAIHTPKYLTRLSDMRMEIVLKWHFFISIHLTIHNFLWSICGWLKSGAKTVVWNKQMVSIER